MVPGPEQLERMKTIVSLKTLPKENFETMAYILKYLKEVEANSNVNRMVAVNIALVFGPCLIHASDDIALQDASVQCFIAKCLLDNYEEIFEPKPKESVVPHHQGRQFILAHIPRPVVQIGTQRGEVNINSDSDTPSSPMNSNTVSEGTTQPSSPLMHAKPSNPPPNPKPLMESNQTQTNDIPKDETPSSPVSRPRSAYTGVKPLQTSGQKEENTFVITSIDDLHMLEDEDGIIDLSKLK